MGAIFLTHTVGLNQRINRKPIFPIILPFALSLPKAPSSSPETNLHKQSNQSGFHLAPDIQSALQSSVRRNWESILGSHFLSGKFITTLSSSVPRARIRLDLSLLLPFQASYTHTSELISPCTRRYEHVQAGKMFHFVLVMHGNEAV